MASRAPMPTRTEDYVTPAMDASTLEQTTSTALTIDGMRRKSDDIEGRSQHDGQSAKTSDEYDTGTDTYQWISGVGADNESSALAGFINAEPSIHRQELEDIYADGRGAVATAGVVHAFDRQKFRQTQPGRQLMRSQKISGVRATGGSSASAGYINAKEQDYRDTQVIQGVTAHQGSVAVAGVGRNVPHYQRTVVGDSRNDTRPPNPVQDAENVGHEPQTTANTVMRSLNKS